MNRRTFLLFAAGAAVARGAAPFFLKPGQRVLFLGDSITQAGMYVEYIETYLRIAFPEAQFPVIKLGLGSETVSGLTEPVHPGPRPDVHDRLASALEKSKPDVVVFNYGMNDGIYHPFGEERFAKYQDGIRRLIVAIRAAGAAPVAMTPPMFDVLPRTTAVGLDAKEFGYKTPYRDYDTVLARYGEWLLSLRADGLPVIDDHRPMVDYVAEQRKSNPRFGLAADGVHPEAMGHWLMAEAVLRAWGVEAAALEAFARALREGNTREAAVFGLVRYKWRVMGPAWLSRVGHKRNPKPVDFAAAEKQAAGIEEAIARTVAAGA